MEGQSWLKRKVTGDVVTQFLELIKGMATDDLDALGDFDSLLARVYLVGPACSAAHPARGLVPRPLI